MELNEALSLPEGPSRTTAIVLLRTCRDEIDPQRLKARATQAGFDTALRALLEFDAEWSSRDPEEGTLEEWANRGPLKVK